MENQSTNQESEATNHSYWNRYGVQSTMSRFGIGKVQSDECKRARGKRMCLC